MTTPLNPNETNPLIFFNIGIGATASERDKAYRNVMKECHPDKFAGDKGKEAIANTANSLMDLMKDASRWYDWKKAFGRDYKAADEAKDREAAATYAREAAEQAERDKEEMYAANLAAFKANLEKEKAECARDKIWNDEYKRTRDAMLERKARLRMILYPLAGVASYAISVILFHFFK